MSTSNGRIILKLPSGQVFVFPLSASSMDLVAMTTAERTWLFEESMEKWVRYTD